MHCWGLEDHANTELWKKSKILTSLVKLRKVSHAATEEDKAHALEFILSLDLEPGYSGESCFK